MLHYYISHLRQIPPPPVSVLAAGSWDEAEAKERSEGEKDVIQE
jgi:hypothetical protein